MRSDETKPQLTRKLLLRVLSYARAYRWQIAGMLVMILLTTGLTLLTPLIFRRMIDVVIPKGDLKGLVLLALALLLIPVFQGLVGVLQRRWNAEVGEGVIYDLRVALFSKLERMSLRFFTNTRIGELMSRLNNDVVGAQDAISNTIVSIVSNGIEAIALLAVMFALEWRLTLVGAAILPLFLLAADRLGRRMRALARRQMDLNAQMNAHMNETLNIGGALLVKLFGRAATEEERFSRRAAAVREAGIQRAIFGTAFFVIVGLVSAVGTAVVYGVGGYLVILKSFTVGTIVAFGSYLGSLYGTLQSLVNAPVAFSTSVVSFERVFEVIDLPEDIAEPADAVALLSPRGELVFDNVDFKYEVDENKLLSDVRRYGSLDAVTAVLSLAEEGRSAADREKTESPDEEFHSQARGTALEGISFRAGPGELVALVGPSGAGKTTLTYLIPRLYDPTGGRILLDGHDLRSLTLSSLTAAIGMVTQETYLFHDTVRTNLLYARPDAAAAEMVEAAKAANIHNFIAELPDGYDTVVGERGYRLSGGERQRIALARVILKNPRILVLDEATSSLDSESEMLIQEALKRVMTGRTNIVIAHRLSTILAADQILVMDRGRIVERGTHRELLAGGGLYAQLYQTQFHREGSR
ncbi:MAG: ABC transporter ATP-binding protein [Anaerolineales bacterium]